MRPSLPAGLPANAEYDEDARCWTVRFDAAGNGKLVYVRAAGPKSLWAQLPKEAHRYEIALRDDEPDAKRFTFYSKEGALDPIPRDAKGRSTGLGERFDTILQHSVLLLVAPHFFQSGDDSDAVNAGSLAPSKRRTAGGRYVVVGPVHDDVWELRFMSDDGDEPEHYFVERDELTRAFTLAADHSVGAPTRPKKASTSGSKKKR